MNQFISVYLDSDTAEASAAAGDVLQRWLRANPANVDRFVRDWQLHHLLHERFVERNLRARAAAMSRATHRAPAGRLRGVSFAIAAMLVIGIGLATALSTLGHHAPTLEAPVAALVETQNAVWDADTGTFEIGSRLQPGFLRLRSGEARIVFDSGAAVTLTGPCEFGLNSAMRGLLRRGKLTAYCPTSAHGFTIAAPGCAVVDLGTAFSLTVDNAGTRIAVLKGRVRVETDTGEKREIALGETARIQEDQPLQITHTPESTAPLAPPLAVFPGDAWSGDTRCFAVASAAGDLLATRPAVGRNATVAYRPVPIPDDYAAFNASVEFSFSELKKETWAGLAFHCDASGESYDMARLRGDSGGFTLHPVFTQHGNLYLKPPAGPAAQVAQIGHVIPGNVYRIEVHSDAPGELTATLIDVTGGHGKPGAILAILQSTDARRGGYFGLYTRDPRSNILFRNFKAEVVPRHAENLERRP